MPQIRRFRARAGLLIIAACVLLLGVTVYSLEVTDSSDRAPTSTPPSPEDEWLREDLEALGVLDDQDTECVLAGFRDAGYDSQDFWALATGATPQGVDPPAYAEATVTMRGCLDDDTLREFTAKSIELAPPSAVRNGFITSLMASSPAAVTRLQAGCVYDSLVGSGFDFAELLVDPEGPANAAALLEVWETCVLT